MQVPFSQRKEPSPVFQELLRPLILPFRYINIRHESLLFSSTGIIYHTA